jgi:sulfur carrier protein ThiS
VKIVYRDAVWELPGRMPVGQAIKKVGLQPLAVLALRDGKLLTADVIVGDSDTIKLIAVVSGG